MSNFLLIAVCLLAGIIVKAKEILPEGSYKKINVWIIYIALPAVSFKYLPHIVWSNELFIPVVAPIIVWFAGWIYISLLSKKLSLDRATTGGLTLIASLSNTSFLGFPLVTAYYGAQHIGTAVICDQVTFLILSTFGVGVAIHASGKHHLSPQLIIAKVFRFPPFIGFVAALTIPRFVDISSLDLLFNGLAATVAPLAIFSIGLQLQISGWKNEIKIISGALFYKLFLAPAIILILVFFLNFKGFIPKVSILEMAMPSLISSAIVSSEYGLNPKLINLVVSVGIVLGLVSTAIWFLIINFTTI